MRKLGCLLLLLAVSTPVSAQCFGGWFAGHRAARLEARSHMWAARAARLEAPVYGCAGVATRTTYHVYHVAPVSYGCYGSVLSYGSNVVPDAPPAE